MKKKIGVVVGIVLCLVIAWHLGTTPSQTIVYTPGQIVESEENESSDEITEIVEQGPPQKNQVLEEDTIDEPIEKEQVIEEKQPIEKEQVIEEKQPIEKEQIIDEKQSIEKEQTVDDKVTKQEIDKEKEQKEEGDAKKQQIDIPKDTTSLSTVVEVTDKELDAAQTDKKKADALKQEIIDNQDYSKKDKYMTDPVPEGKPKPVEPQDTTIDTATSFKVKLSVSCGTILNNMKLLNKNKYELVPDDGIIFPLQEVTAYKGESVFDVLLREMQNKKIHMEFVNTPMYNSAYIEGINNLYEFDVGELSGWMYKVNEWFPNYGCSRYQVYEGDVIEWVYTCDLGRDVGDTYYDNK